MGNFNQRGGSRGGFKSDRRGSGQGNFGNRDRQDRGPVTMHKAICAECGDACEVPFVPSGEKPIYCNSCFASKRNSGGDGAPRRDFGRQDFSRNSFDKTPDSRSGNEETKRQFETINIKLDQLTRSIDYLIKNMGGSKTDGETENMSASVTKSTMIEKPTAIKKNVTVKKLKKN